MTFSPELRSNEEVIRLMEARNNQSHALIEAAQNLLKQASEIDLSNIATEILYRYPEAHVIVLLEDQRTDYKGAIFCGHINDENSKKLENSFEAKEFVDSVLSFYKFPYPKNVVERFINLREYAEKKPSWFATTPKG